MQLFTELRLWLRDWLGVSQFQKRTRTRLDILEEKVAISQDDLDRLNAATSRIAARVTSLLDQVDALGTGNDDSVRQAQQVADVQEASSQLRPVLEQLEALGADASNVVPEPTPEQVPVEPGPDVAPVENGGGAVVTDPTTPADTSTPGEPTPGSPDGDVTFNPDGTVPGETQVNDDGVVTTPAEPLPASETGSGETIPGPSGDEAAPTER